jgi:hypothetical protein
VTDFSVAYIGNFEPPHSTENHVAEALERGLGIDVIRFQENNPQTWELGTFPRAFDRGPDLILWTRTASLSAQIPESDRRAALDEWRRVGVPVVGYHLDRWWGLEREHEVHQDPFFQVMLLITADGGHDERWAAAGVTHLWMPPAVSEFECTPGLYDEAYDSDVAFIGSWQGYHLEWTHRLQLVEYLRSWYGDRVRFWPQPGQPAVRGAALRDLYASTKVNVGDSCLVGGARRYWSDRIPETLGRGGFLIHPEVDGLQDHFTSFELPTWPLGDWDALHHLIDKALSSHDWRRASADAGQQRVLRDHTYTVRMRQMLAAVAAW